MRKRIYRYLKIGCLCVLCVAAGALIESHRVKVTEGSHPSLHRTEADEAVNRVIPEVDLEGIPFNQAVEKAQKFSSVPIIVHWEKLAAAGYDVRLPVTFRARNVALGRLISQLLTAIQREPNQYAAYVSAGDCILISTVGDDDPRDVVVCVYDVRDFLKPPADPWEIRDRPGPLVAYPQVAPQPPPTEDDLERLIQERVAFPSWGRLGSMRFFAGRLIVTQTWDNQRQIAELLNQLRQPAPPLAPPPPTPDLEIWNDALKPA